VSNGLTFGADGADLLSKSTLVAAERFEAGCFFLDAGAFGERRCTFVAPLRFVLQLICQGAQDPLLLLACGDQRVVLQFDLAFQRYAALPAVR